MDQLIVEMVVITHDCVNQIVNEDSIVNMCEINIDSNQILSHETMHIYIYICTCIQY